MLLRHHLAATSRGDINMIPCRKLLGHCYDSKRDGLSALGLESGELGHLAAGRQGSAAGIAARTHRWAGRKTTRLAAEGCAKPAVHEVSVAPAGGGSQPAGGAGAGVE